MKKNERDHAIQQITRRLEPAAPEIIDDMMSTLHAPGTPASVKVRIYEILLDRLMGRPEATIRLEDTGTSMEEAEKIVASIAEGIRKHEEE
ncbi:MAG: hypothetical protein K6E83_04650 [Clostridium sp.]|nr:hypothetical protein [Clostridium sp.]